MNRCEFCGGPYAKYVVVDGEERLMCKRCQASFRAYLQGCASRQKDQSAEECDV